MAVIVSGEHIGSYAIADIWFKGAQPNWANPQTLDNFLFENHIEELTKAIKDSIGFPVQAIFLRSKGRSFAPVAMPSF
ncbi:MAG: hypothetical protein IPJ69_05535 [Deltaproteobacteria bacterium]|nr:MAG: hypothetical protein IPJ69_05535 [Deltaproteobacteria bacterium]